jgi:hypothetical protein
MRNLAFISALFLLASCSNVDQELSEVKALQEQLSKSEQVFQKWDLEHMTQVKSEVESLLDSVSNHYTNKNLVMDIPTGVIMAEFKSSAKAFRKATGDYTQVKNELTLSKEQLDNLAKDLSSGAMEKDSAVRYISEEKLAVKSVYDQVFKLDTMYMRAERMYTDKRPKVDSLIATFKQSH